MLNIGTLILLYFANTYGIRLHPGFDTHGQSHQKPKTQGTNVPTKRLLVTIKPFKNEKKKKHLAHIDLN